MLALKTQVTKLASNSGTDVLSILKQDIDQFKSGLSTQYQVDFAALVTQLTGDESSITGNAFPVATIN